MSTNERDDDVVVEANWLIELGNALNVAGDRCHGAASRLRHARTDDARSKIREELRGFLRRTIAGATIAFAVLGETGGITKGPTP